MQFGKKLLIILILSLQAGGISSRANTTDFNSEAIRVRLEKQMSEFSLQGIGVQIFGRETAFEKVSLPKMQKIKISRELLQGRVVWKVQRLEGKNTHQEIIVDRVLAIKGIFLKNGSKNLPQSFFLWPQGPRKFDLIGVMPLEEYLVGVLAGEMPASWPLQTLKSQAIAARTYALAVMNDRKSNYFHVESSVMDQVFSMSPFKNLKFKRAVQETENLVLTDKKGRILKTFFHSDCGGKTADARSVWGAGAGTDIVLDSSCPNNPKAKWKLRMSQDQLNKATKSFGETGAGDLESIRSLHDNKDAKDERASEIELTWKSGFKKSILAQDFRQALGFEKLKSTLFTVERSRNDFVFSGQGFGHGVGLCQWGARTLALAGNDFIDILKHYYPQGSLYLRQYQVPGAPKIIPEIKPELRLGLLKQKVQL